MNHPIVTFQTTAGTFKAELYPEIAPNTVKNFVSLAKKGRPALTSANTSAARRGRRRWRTHGGMPPLSPS